MLTRTKIKGPIVLLYLFSIYFVTSCQNDTATKKETSTENKKDTAQMTLKDVHFDFSMMMGNDKMLYLKYNNAATGMGAVLSCDAIDPKDYNKSNIPAKALAACLVASAQGNALYYAIKEGDALLIFRGNGIDKSFNEHLIIPLI
jgi:hypothetical protein